MFGYVHDICAPTAPVAAACKVGYHCSLQGSLLGVTDDSFPPLVECTASSIMKASP